MQVGDIVKMTDEGYNYLRKEIMGITNNSVGLIVKKYLYEDGDSLSNGQYVYDVLFPCEIALSLFDSQWEICYGFIRRLFRNAPHIQCSSLL